STVRLVAMAIALVTAAGAAAEGPLPAQAPAPVVVKNPARVTTMRELLATSKPGDWRTLDPDHTLYIELATGRVVIELAPAFAPRHVANIETIARAHWYDGLAITRVQDNFVAQWGDPLGSRPDVGERRLPAEFTRSGVPTPYVRLKDPDTYAPEVGFAGGFPVARSGADGEAWLVHCYGMVGVGRDNDPATAIGTELYAVIGQAPRQLDRNAALVGRIVWGIELLSSLPRGTGELGFYEQPEQRVPIQTVRVAAELPPAERLPLEVLRTDTPLFQKLVEIRRNRRDVWYKTAAGRIDLCNVPLPVREKSEKSEKTKG
ncbi:MAG TPA: peptidylprolyl isomerase, partial [Steroidobacteraceae bacterium]|nr:peptidylprolyl isomerase [Steroidobacteraceae bacterium]